MTRKYELSISTGYLPNWGLVEAIRELFQNALDNEIENPKNKMTFSYDNGTIRITNKTSKLSAETMLLGSSSKAGNENTIGQHGEGYKIAIMVLLRGGKQVTLYNYGKREVWTTRLVNSKRFGCLVPTIFVETEAVWKKVPDSDLTWEVSGITPEEFADIKKKNLHLRQNEITTFDCGEELGRILLDPAEAGNIYVKGLYVCTNKNFKHGYDFPPTSIKLDRDRKLVDSFDISWGASKMWTYGSSKNDEIKQEALKLFKNGDADARYINNMHNKSDLVDAIAYDFYEANGEAAVPVTSNDEYERVSAVEGMKAVIVSSDIKQVIESSAISSGKRVDDIAEKESVQSLLKEFISKIEGKLTDEELDELNRLVDLVEN